MAARDHKRQHKAPAKPVKEEAPEQFVLGDFPWPMPEDVLGLEQMAGPTEYSNWLVRERLLIGAVPKRTEIVRALLQHGITIFVDLMEEREIARQGRRYIELAHKLLNEETGFPQKPKDLNYIHFPIYDKGVAEDADVIKLVEDLLLRLRRGQKIYLHCRGGHGRSGTIAALLLARIYGLIAYDALELTQRLHNCRTDSKLKAKGYSSPETHEQKSQVYRIIAEWEAQKAAS